MSAEVTELILYACPLGELAGQLDAYFARTAAVCARNQAHRYPPHVTLTGFFHDETGSIPRYVQALDAALGVAPKPSDVRVRGAVFEPHFHGLLVESSWLQALTADFAARVQSPTRVDALRLKGWLHLSLAYGFSDDMHACLYAAARVLVDPSAPVRWEIRLYQRFGADQWRCHAARPLIDSEAGGA